MAGSTAQIFLVSSLVYLVMGQQTSNVPNITDLSALQNVSLSETLPIGYTLGIIDAYDPDGTKVTFKIMGEGFEYFKLDKDTGEVTLKSGLDFEVRREIQSQIVVTDENNQISTADVFTKVVDENDELPQFTSYTLKEEIYEDRQPNDTESIVAIEVTDIDTKGSVIELKCNGGTPLQRGACNTFGLQRIEGGNRRWLGYLYLKETVDYETRKSYVIPLEAYDGVNRQTNEVKITVRDVNDSPPVWDKTGPKFINEEHPIGTPIMSVTATDQDTESKRDIFYELIGDFSDVFTIGNLSGVISNSDRLDFDSPDSRKDKAFDITIKAREIMSKATENSPPVLGNDPKTTATIDIKITMKDINDNAPEFIEDGKIKTSYTVSIDENIASGQNIPGLLMTVTDKDQTENFNTFALDTDKYKDVFRIIPQEDSSSTSPTIYVVDGNKIDFEDGPRSYVIEVTAIESRTSPAFTGSTQVIINVENVNDETPRFEQNSYRVNLTEGAPAKTPVVLVKAFDDEEGVFGNTGIRYVLLANIPEHFTINERTGQISVKECGTPGEFPCIDFEKRQQYILTVSATDNEGIGGLSRSVQVIIDILDENDNEPKMEPEYKRYIYEGSRVTINPLIIEAEDPDTVGGPVTYSLKEFTGFWNITMQTDPADGSRYANITATKDIKYEDAPNQEKGEFTFIVVAYDEKSSTTAKIVIVVIDINNNAPFFLAPAYRVSLTEDTFAETSLLRVSADDLDSPTTDNGVISFSIGSGFAGKFQLKNAAQDDQYFSVDIFTTQDADFDFEKQRVYNLTLVAQDGGTPQSLTGTASFIVQIEDSNNVVPVISPTSITINVREDSAIGKSVHKINAADPDLSKVLRYFMKPESAITPTGARAEKDFTNLFKVDDLTGVVTVNGKLDRDLVSFITNEVTVEDQGSNPVQTGSGALFIRITEVNDQDPYFVDGPYNVTLDEEKTRNSYVLNLECNDTDDDIAEYQITQLSPRFSQYFTLLPDTGAVIVNDRIDYETLSVDYITLFVTCIDTGRPARTANTSVYAYINNINDNSPIFNKTFYRGTLEERETTITETYLLTVAAYDIDRGDYGVVQYELSSEDPFFRIDTKGNIFVKQNASFDREASPTYDLQVVAYDSPKDPSVRRNTSAPVYIAISDINDNCPFFTRTDLSADIPESFGANVTFMDIVANDLDIGLNGQLEFAIEVNTGDPKGAEQLFSIDSRENYGRLYTAVSLKNRVGIKQFNVTVTDKGPNPCTTKTQVTVNVQESQNDAPEWERPPRSKYIIYVLESQYNGMLVYSSKARDPNQGPNGVVDYFFSVNNQLVSNTAEFRINRVTGVIRADVVFDREQVDTYFLSLVAQDQGTPSASSLTTLEVIILDVDDNDPKFRMKNGAVEPLVLPADGEELKENVPLQKLGSCKYLATDADSDTENNRIYFRLLTTSQKIQDHISVDRRTCDINLIKAVDYELHPTLEFEILAFNEKNDDTVIRYQKREVNPSILPAVVIVTDVNDNTPVFDKDTYLACASVDTPYRETILQVQATDPDFGDTNKLQYSLLTGTTDFGIDKTLGTIHNNISFRYGNRGQKLFELNVRATDPGDQTADAKAIIFVTDSTNLVKLKVDRPRVDVEPFKELLISTIKSNSGGDVDFACIDSVSNHETVDGDENTAASDVYVMAAKENSNGDYSIIPAGELANMIGAMLETEDNTLSDIYVAQVEAKDDSDDWDIDEDEVLAIFIICILLIFLALILLCIGCYCIHNSKKKKVRKLKAERHTVVEVGQQPVETSVNPVYSVGSDNVEYATVQKGRHSKQTTPPVLPISPMVIPSPEDEQAAEPQLPEPVVSSAITEDTLPVIETEVMDDPLPSQDPEPVFVHPEFEDKIETVIVDDEPHSGMDSSKETEQALPNEDKPASVDGEIDVEIKDTPPASPQSERKERE